MITDCAEVSAAFEQMRHSGYPGHHRRDLGRSHYFVMMACNGVIGGATPAARLSAR